MTRDLTKPFHAVLFSFCDRCGRPFVGFFTKQRASVEPSGERIYQSATTNCMLFAPNTARFFNEHEIVLCAECSKDALHARDDEVATPGVLGVVCEKQEATCPP